MSKHLFSCVECGGSVRDRAGRGREAEYLPGVSLPVPDDFAIPTCTKCGEQYFSAELAERLAMLQRPVYAKHVAALLKRLQRRHGVTLRAIERACGVTPTYLSHVIKGRKTPSATLLRLIEAFDAAPGEFARHTPESVWHRSEPKLASLPFLDDPGPVFGDTQKLGPIKRYVQPIPDRDPPPRGGVAA